jgi:Zn-dependent protease
VPLIILLVTKGMLFGWAKPVPVSIGSLRRPKQDMVWVAAAGPGSNLLMAVGWAILFSVLRGVGVQEPFFQQMAVAGIQVNLVLMALNLLPVPPLDGGRIMVGLLPHRMSHQFARIEPYGLLIVIFLLATGTLGVFLSPFLQFGKAIVGVFV